MELKGPYIIKILLKSIEIKVFNAKGDTAKKERKRLITEGWRHLGVNR